MKSKCFLIVVTLFGGIFSTVRAGAPVVDLNQDAPPPMSQSLEIDQEEGSFRHTIHHQNESLEQRVFRLERQISNITEMNFLTKFEKMQQEIQQLHGQIEVQDHDLSQLKEQVRNFYQDLDQRLSKIKPASVQSERNAIQESAPLVGKGITKSTELQAYEVAFNFLNQKNYEKAIKGFQEFIQNYPASDYAVNAHYWLGEIYYLKKKADQANKEFQIIITNYPDSLKVADAMLKVALIAMDAGNYAKAKQNLVKVQKQFPGSTAAKIATLRLKEITK
jgi:tol-pal system protein YbgF